jgi:gliding motility-associated-like protein
VSGGKGSGYTYTWTGGKTTSAITEKPSTASWFKVTGSDGCSPAVSDSVRINLFLPLSVNKIKDTTLCDGQNLPLNMTVSGGNPKNINIKWIPASVSGLTPVLNPAVGTTLYKAIATDGCTVKEDTAVFNVTMLPPLTGTISVNPAPVCEGDSVTIDLSIKGGKTASRIWSVDGVPVTWLKKRDYQAVNHVYIFSLNDGCSVPASYNFNLVVNKRPGVTFKTGGFICAGEEAELSHFCAEPVTLSWLFGPKDSVNGTGSGTIIKRKYSKPGLYTFMARSTTANGCSQLHLVNKPADVLHVLSIPKASFAPDASIINIQSPTVNFIDKSGNCNNWNWFFGDGFTSTAAGSTSHAYSDTGNFKVMLIVDTLGICFDTAYATLWVRNKYEVFMPTSFSPNEDGRNDRYIPYMTGIKSFEMAIFDRWGNKVFESNALNKMWDGKNRNGEPMPLGVYIVSLVAKDNDGYKHEEKATITLMR